MGDCHPIWIPIGICAGILVMTSSILLGCSFSILDPLEYGLEVNGNTMQVADRLYRSGRYSLGLGHYFERFPRKEKAIVFLSSSGETRDIAITDNVRRESSIPSRTSEGMRTGIGMSIQYKVGIKDLDSKSLEDQIHTIFERHGTSWESFLVRIASEAVRNVSKDFTAFELFQKRAEVGDAVFEELSATFAKYYFECKSVTLMNIGVDDALQDAIQETEIVNQEILEKEYFIDAKEIETATRVLVAETTGKLLVDGLTTDGMVYSILKTAEAEAVISKLQIEKDALVDFNIGIDFTTQEQSDVQSHQSADTSANNFLLSYFWIQTVEQTSASLKVNSDLPSPIPLNIS